MKKDPYSKVKIKDKVIFCESGYKIPCIVENIYYKDNIGPDKLKCFLLNPLEKDVITKSFEVTIICADSSAWCPWYFKE